MDTTTEEWMLVQDSTCNPPLVNTVLRDTLSPVQGNRSLTYRDTNGSIEMRTHIQERKYQTSINGRECVPILWLKHVPRSEKPIWLLHGAELHGRMIAGSVLLEVKLIVLDLQTKEILAVRPWIHPQRDVKK